MLDLHTHVLPGLDDGARTLEDSCEIARRSLADGVTTLAATPHVRADYPTTVEDVERGVAEVRRRLADEGIGVEVIPGGEVDLSRFESLSAEEVAGFTYAQAGRYLLLEFPYYGWPLALEPIVHRLRADGVTAVLAHPERNAEVQERPTRLASLVEAGVAVQITAASLVGTLGRRSKRASEALLDLGLVHLLASDAHGPHVRDAGLVAAAERLGDGPAARMLTEDGPAAIAAGEPLPRPVRVRLPGRTARLARTLRGRR